MVTSYEWETRRKIIWGNGWLEFEINSKLWTVLKLWTAWNIKSIVWCWPGENGALTAKTLEIDHHSNVIPSQLVYSHGIFFKIDWNDLPWSGRHIWFRQCIRGVIGLTPYYYRVLVTSERYNSRLCSGWRQWLRTLYRSCKDRRNEISGKNHIHTRLFKHMNGT